MTTLTAFAWSLGFVCGACVAAHLCQRQPGQSGAAGDTSATMPAADDGNAVENMARRAALVEGNQPATMPQGDEADACVSCPACWIAASEAINVRGLDLSRDFGQMPAMPECCPSHEARFIVLADAGVDLFAFEANMRHYVAVKS